MSNLTNKVNEYNKLIDAENKLMAARWGGNRGTGKKVQELVCTNCQL